MIGSGGQKGAQPYIYTYPFSPKLPSQPGCHMTLSRVPSSRLAFHKGPAFCSGGSCCFFFCLFLPVPDALWDLPRDFFFGSCLKETATHSSILAWKISWTEKRGGLQFMGSQRVGHDWVTFFYFCPQEEAWVWVKLWETHSEQKIKGFLTQIYCLWIQMAAIR